MAVVCLKPNILTNNMNNGPLTRSLERILDEASSSGELKLSNRKLKDFPRSAQKYNLSHNIVIAGIYK